MKIVGITACIAGIAHTYMAAANLKKFAKKENCEIKIETQGAMGIENELTQAEIDEADVVIFAVDTTVQNEDRFNEKKILEVGTSKVVKDGKATIQDAIKLAKGE